MDSIPELDLIAAQCSSESEHNYSRFIFNIETVAVSFPIFLLPRLLKTYSVALVLGWTDGFPPPSICMPIANSRLLLHAASIEAAIFLSAPIEYQMLWEFHKVILGQEQCFCIHRLWVQEVQTNLITVDLVSVRVWAQAFGTYRKSHADYPPHKQTYYIRR